MKTRATNVTRCLAAALGLAATAIPPATATCGTHVPPYPNAYCDRVILGAFDSARADCYAPRGHPHGTVIARSASFTGGAGAKSLQGGLTYQALATGWYTINAEVKYAALAETFGLGAIATTSVALGVNDQLYGDIVAGSVSVPLPSQWLDAAVSLAQIAVALHEVLQGPQVKTYTVTRKVRFKQGERFTVYAGVMAKTSAALSFAAGFIGGEVKSITVVGPVGGSGRLQLRVEPSPILAGTPTTVTVHAEDAADHTPISGVIRINGREVGCTGVPFTSTFDCGATGTVTAPTYPETRVPFDVRNCRLIATASPRELPLNQPVQVTVSAKDAVTRATVAGKVKVNGAAVADTNLPFTYTFRPVRRRLRDPETGRWVEVFVDPTVTVSAPRYQETPVDVKFRN